MTIYSDDQTTDYSIISPALFFIGIGAIHSICSKVKYYRSLDKYPEKLKVIVDRIQNSITKDLYNGLIGEVRINPHDVKKIISESRTTVVQFSEAEEWVVKATKSTFFDEIYDLFSADFRASNSEGSVKPTSFSLASRVTLAKSLRRIIKKNHLDRIVIPKKYLLSFPQEHIPFGALALHRHHVFVISEFREFQTKPPAFFSHNDQNELARQLDIFFRESGVLDLHKENIGFIGKKIYFFDTEELTLSLESKFCLSTQLKMARINWKNMQNYLEQVNSLNCVHLSVLCEKSVAKLYVEESLLLKKIVIIGAFCLFMYISTLQYF